MILLFKEQSSSEKSNSWQKFRVSVLWALLFSVSKEMYFPSLLLNQWWKPGTSRGQMLDLSFSCMPTISHTQAQKSQNEHSKKWWIGDFRTQIDLKFLCYVWLSVEKEKMGENECELQIQSRACRSARQRCFWAGNGTHLFLRFQRLNAGLLCVTSTFMFCSKLEFTFPEGFSLQGFISHLFATTWEKNQLHRRWAEGLFLDTRISYSLM